MFGGSAYASVEYGGLLTVEGSVVERINPYCPAPSPFAKKTTEIVAEKASPYSSLKPKCES